jgi:hypothetical protein
VSIPQQCGLQSAGRGRDKSALGSDVNGGAGAALVMASARKKGPPAFGGPSLGRNALRSKAPLEPVTSKDGRRLFPAVFTQKGKWLRDRFFGTEAVKSVHGIERRTRGRAPAF